MGGVGSQTRLLVWKNYIQYKRRPKMVICQIIIPLMFIVALFLARGSYSIFKANRFVRYDPKPFDIHHATFEFIGIAPTKSVAVQELITFMNESYEYHMDKDLKHRPKFKLFDTENDMREYISDNPKKIGTSISLGNVKNDAKAALPKRVRVGVHPVLSLEEEVYWGTTTTYWSDGIQPYQNTQGYNEVMYFQHLMTKSLAMYWLSKIGGDPSQVNFNISTQMMPVALPPRYAMAKLVMEHLPKLIIYTMAMNILMHTKSLVEEKQLRHKETMKLMGLSPTAHWISWLVTFLAFLVLFFPLITILLCAPIVGKPPILKHSSSSLILFFFMIYAFSTITYCFMFAAMFNSANIAATVSVFVFLATYIPISYITKNYMKLARATKFALNFFTNISLIMGIRIITLHERTGVGARWSNLATVNTDDNWALLDCILMLCLDTFLHLLIYWYIDNVWPGDFGVPKPLYFCFQKSYWTGGKTEKVLIQPLDVVRDPDKFEHEPTHLEIGVQIKELTKVYGDLVAVNKMSLNMYKGQITVLLGHNGAGKTTTMSMLTGFTAPTSGTAIVGGHDITTDMMGVRKSLGLCPQHNVLFDTLNVVEHIEFFASLKGASTKELLKEVTPLLYGVGLMEKKFQQARFLSGGQKRKLCVAIAMVAQSQVVVLDEPTAGMDPQARRFMWSYLQKSAESRTILLTTHYMDEADVLGDRIAIMAQGVVKCCGSSMFLKKLYAAGYSLIIVRLPTCVLSKLTDVVISHVDTATLKSVVNQEVTFILPENETSKFPNLFKALEEQKNDLGITSFGTTATTMEQVFIKVGESAHEDGDDFNENMADNVIDIDQPGVANYKPGHWQDKGLDLEYLNTTENAMARLTIMGDDSLVKSTHRSTAVDIVSTVSQDSHRLSRMKKVEKNIENLNSDLSEMMKFTKGYVKNKGLGLQMARMRGVIVKKALHTLRNPFIFFVQALGPVLCIVLYMFMLKMPDIKLEEIALTLDLARYDPTVIPTTAGTNATPEEKRLETLYGNQFNERQKVESFNLSEYGSYDDYLLKLFKSLKLLKFNRRVIVGMEVESTDSVSGLRAIAHHSAHGHFAKPIGVNFLMNSVLQFYLDDSYSIQTVLEPLPMRGEFKDLMKVVNLVIDTIQAAMMTFTMCLSMAVLTGTFLYYYILERQVGSKHIQEVSGVGIISYWLPSFIWDLFTYTLVCLIILLVFVAFKSEAFIGGLRGFVVVFLFFMHGFAAVPFMYVLQFRFDSPANGTVGATLINLFFGSVGFIIVALITTFIPLLNGLLMFVLKVLAPNFTMSIGLMYMYTNYNNYQRCKNATCAEGDDLSLDPCCEGRCVICATYQNNYLAWDYPGLGPVLLFFFCTGTFYLSLVFIIEKKLIKRLFSKASDGIVRNQMMNEKSFLDDDVGNELDRLNSTPLEALVQSESLLMINLHKKYTQLVAVHNICVGIPKEECFGLLGQNGAGKTSVFKMLTGHEDVSGGNAYLGGYSVITDIAKVRDNMGYCPQFDALLDFMTTRETLTFFGRLRGVPKAKLKDVVINLLKILTLTPHADKLVSALSGGNKRKLSTAVSLIGMPEFILLDEPSAGIDPEARRVLWNVLSQVRALGHTLILTSHSMEECDALCTSLAIMVNGRFVCLGSPQHLKNKFGKGYTLIVKTKVSGDGKAVPSEPLVQYITLYLPGAMVFDNHEGYIHLQVPDSSINLGDVFSLMEATKQYFEIEDYAVHQTTLEQIFLAFTSVQHTLTQPPSKQKGLIPCC